MRSRILAAIPLLVCLAPPLVAGCDERVPAIEADSSFTEVTACPEEPTADMAEGLPCALPSGTICSYRVSDTDPRDEGWQAFACGCAAAEKAAIFSICGACQADGVWYMASATSHDVARTGQCPDSEPTEGSSCDPASFAVGCVYFVIDPSILMDDAECIEPGTWRITSITNGVCGDE